MGNGFKGIPRKVVPSELSLPRPARMEGGDPATTEAEGGEGGGVNGVQQTQWKPSSSVRRDTGRTNHRMPPRLIPRSSSMVY